MSWRPLLLFTFLLVAGAPTPSGDLLLRQGADSFHAGQFADAIATWRDAQRLYAQAGNIGGQCDALADLAMAFQEIGQFAEAGTALADAQRLAEQSRDRRRLATILGNLGSYFTFTRRFDDADAAIVRGVSMLEAGDTDIAAALQCDLGNLRSWQLRTDEAAAAYEKSAGLAQQAGNPILAARALADAALSASRPETQSHDPTLSGRGAPTTGRGLEVVETIPQPAVSVAHAADLCRRALKAGRQVASDSERARILCAVGRAMEQVESALPQRDAAEWRRDALDADAAALAAANSTNDRLTASYALGQIGHLYEVEGRLVEALEATRRATLLAESQRSPYALYRWQWQTGRLLAAEGKEQDAIAAYQSAVTTLQPLQNDLVFGYGNHGPEGTFRESVAPVFYQLGDLLLRRANSAAAPADEQRALFDARQAIESLKSGELQDYFQDPCVNLLRSRIKPVESVSSHTAVVYIIPLASRTELLIGIGPDLRRIRVPIEAARLDREVREFRVNLQNPANDDYLANARRLYEWLIRPMDPLLGSRAIDTLVFVPDGALRSVPLAALQDGKRFLIERYAVAVTPGLTLMDPRPVPRTRTDVLAAGLSTSVDGFPALASVPEELSAVHHLFGGVELLNSQFVKPALRRELADNDFTILHIASHGNFSGDIRQTFILAYDGKLTLDQLAQFIEPSRFRRNPLQLVTLSACQTAAGDDRAALGLAGAAVKAGARSVVGSLWSVSDEATEQLISDFYADLRDHPEVSKAQALQHAQEKLMRTDRFRHPCYWSPFLVIGNWL